MPANTFPLPAWGNASSDQLGYDGAGRMITKRYLTGGIDGTTHAYTNTTALVGHTTSFDRAGNKLYERHLEAESRSHLYQPFNNDGSFGVGYDSANRLRQYQRGVLSSATIPYLVNPGASISTPTTLPGADQVRTYGLDGLGNWKTTNFTLVGSGGSTTSTAEVRQHNYVNQITSTRDNGGTPTPFVYDQLVFPPYLGGNGNIVNDGIRIYQYDVYNRLIEVKKASDSTVLATYVYDGLNRRIQKTISNGGLSGDITNGTTDYLYDGQQIVEERDHSTDDWKKVNFWGQYIDELMFLAVSVDDAPVTYRVLSDLLYRSVALVTTSNVVIEAYDCDAYGNTLCYSGPGTDGLWFTDDDVTTHSPINATIFTGRQYDPESQIYYYRARYFSPVIGRFISRDPLPNAEMTQGPNLYWYVQNNPIDNVDPTGLVCGDNPNGGECEATASGPTLMNSAILQDLINDLIHQAVERSNINAPIIVNSVNVAIASIDITIIANNAKHSTSVPTVPLIPPSTEFPYLIFSNICPSDCDADYKNPIASSARSSLGLPVTVTGNTARVDIHTSGAYGRFLNSLIQKPNYEAELLASTITVCCLCSGGSQAAKM